MHLRGLIAELPNKKGTAFTFERGQIVSHPHAALHDEVMRTRAALSEWGVRPGMRVGIYAPNSYRWLVHDLALLDIGAIAVGKQADLAFFTLDELRFSGAGDLLAALVLCGAHSADRVMVKGAWRVVDALPVGVDLVRLRREHGEAARAFLEIL